ncbi:MAG TPA: T9SS type A sorting domain-containing protein [Flavipsychrobacter sp.]|nr:T9SS type A sorting domain-containing protein [Flavipsychrobacter sp.]
MKKSVLLLKTIALSLCSMLIMLSSARALTFTAVASGNFSNSLTWGGTVPPSLVAADIIIIPNGITVNLDQNVSFIGTATLTVNGTLTSGTYTSALIMTAGQLAGTGSIIVDSMSTALVSGITYTGSITADALTTLATNFSSAATITVNNSLNVMAGLLNITDGSLTMGNNSTIVIDGGTISVGGTGTIGLSGNYNVVYEGTSASAGVELSGTGLQDVTLNLSSGALTLTSDVSLDGTLTLTSGNLILNNNDLTFEANSDISAMGTGTINSSAGSNITINSTGGFSGDLTFGTGNNTVNNLSITLGSSSANVDLGSDININGTLTLGMGTLTLNNNDLSFAVNGNVAVTGTGAIVSTSGSNISITSNNSFTGALNFSSTGNTVGTLTINMGNNTSSVNLGSDLNVSGTLNLTSGDLNVWDNNLMINAGATVNGGSDNSYVITVGGGQLTMNLAANASQTFHVGTAMNYSPAMISANTGSVTSDISVSLSDTVYSSGTMGSDLTIDRSLVNATWFITSSASTGLDLDLQLMWNQSMEVNGFDRTQAYISHYMGGNWDVMATSSATTSGNLYVLNRNNVTSLSPFVVADANSALSVNNTLANAEAQTTVYPNPAADVVNFTAPGKVTGVTVYDVSGRKVKSVPANGNSFSVSELTPGYYNVQLTGKDFSAVQHFIKK